MRAPSGVRHASSEGSGHRIGSSIVSPVASCVGEKGCVRTQVSTVHNQRNTTTEAPRAKIGAGATAEIHMLESDQIPWPGSDSRAVSLAGADGEDGMEGGVGAAI